jgi:hypothetical protein
MYFSKFPIVSYPSNITDEKKYVLARNIIRRIGFSEDTKSASGAFLEYSVKDGERPEHIADRVYGNPEEHWVVLLSNEIIDPYHGWYKSGSVIEEYINKKYSGYSVFFTNTGNTFSYNTNLFSGCTLTQSGNSSSITEYHPTLCKLIVASPSFSNGTATIGLSGGGNLTIKIQRILPSYTAVHHFEIQGPTADGHKIGALDTPTVDPLSKQTNQYNQYSDLGMVGSPPPETGIRQTTTPSGSNIELWETYIGKYMGISGSAVNTYAVSNFTYENTVNDSKRLIRVLHPRYLDTVKRELESLLRV